MKNRRRSSRLRLSAAAGLCVMILGAPPVAQGQQQNSNEVVTKLIETRRANFQKMGDFSATAVTSRKRFVFAGPDPNTAASVDEEINYARSGDRYRWERSYAITYQTGSKHAFKAFSVSNGTADARYESDDGKEGGGIYKARKEMGVNDPMIALFNDAWFSQGLSSWDQLAERYHCKAEETTIEGQRAYVIEMTANPTCVGTYVGSATSRWWVLPDKGCLITRYETRGSQGELLEEMVYSDFEQLPSGAWINHKVEDTTYDAKKSGQVYGSRTVTVSDVKENVEFPADYFEFRFPPGLPIYNEFVGGSVKPPADLINEDLMHDINSSEPSTRAIGSTGAMVASVNSSEKEAAAPGKDDESPAWEVWIALGVIAAIIAVWLLSRRAAGRGRGGDKPSK